MWLVLLELRPLWKQVAPVPREPTLAVPTSVRLRAGQSQGLRMLGEFRGWGLGEGEGGGQVSLHHLLSPESPHLIKGR